MIITRENMREHAQFAHNYSGPETVDIGEPITLDGHIPDELLDKVGTFDLPQPLVAEFRDTAVLGPGGVGVTVDGGIILDTAYSGRLDTWERNQPYFAMAMDARAARPIGAEIFMPMMGVWSDNYFHWHAEFLPRLEGIERYQRRHRRKVPLTVPPFARKFVFETLDLLGFAFDQAPSYHIIAQKLIVPTFRRHHGRTSAKSIRWLKKRMWQALDRAGTPEGAVQPSHIYISREDAEERRIVNDPEVLEALQKFGPFQKVVLTGRPFAEQARLFERAEFVVSPHGAGLTNAIYARGKPKILEIFGQYVNPCYFALFSALDYPYAVLETPTQGKDIIVNTKKLQSIMGSFEEKARVA